MLTTDLEAADFVLAINTSGKVMQEAWDQETKAITYFTGRNLRYFTATIAHLIQQGKPVAIADVAFANGGETELIEMLDDQGCLDQLIAYTGWNTACNTLGTAIATGILSLGTSNGREIQRNLIHHLLEDWLYQSMVRSQIINDYLPTIDASYYDFNGQDQAIAQTVTETLLEQWRSRLHNSFKATPFKLQTLTFPWHRMFEIDLEVVLEDSP